MPHDGDRILIEQILSISRVLLENCGNRSLFSSSSHLSHLLNTSSLSLLKYTLRLGLRLAQRYSETRLRSGNTSLPAINKALLASHYHVDLAKLECIAQPFVKNVEISKQQPGKIKETDKGIAIAPTYATDLLPLVQGQDNGDKLWELYGHPWLNFLEDSSGANNQPAISNGLHVQSMVSDSQPQAQEESSSTDPADGRAPSMNGKALKRSYKLVDIPPKRLAETSIHALAQEFLPLVPKASRYELFTRIRNAHALVHSIQHRQELVGLRILALANLSNIYPEHSLQQQVLQYEADEPRRSQIPYQLCGLVHPPGSISTKVPKSLQSIALIALVALTNHRSKSSEVSAALGVSVNHGALTYAARRAVTELEGLDKDAENVDSEDLEWREGLFELLHILPRTNNRAGEGFVSAGLLDAFVGALKLRTLKAELNHPRTLNFLDVFVYNTRDAFNALVNASGLDLISELLAHEVEVAMSSASKGEGMPQEYKTPTTDFKVTFFQQQTLRAIFKVVKNMMAINGGPFDRMLRNLIESSQLLGGLKVVIVNPEIFGSNVWSGAVEIFSSFIHNEPTSYAAIAEAGLTKAFLDLVTSLAVTMQQDQGSGIGNVDLETFEKKSCSRILPNAEAITVVPLAFGAICLNEVGRGQLEQSKALDLFFHILTMRPYVQALANAPDSDIESLGSNFDELARHHPRLKPSIVRGLFDLTETMGQAICADETLSNGARLCVKDSQGHSVADTSLGRADMLGYRRLSEPTGHPESSAAGVDNESEADPQVQNGTQDVLMTDVSSEHIQSYSQVFEAKLRIKNASTAGALHSSPGPSERIGILATILSGFFHNPSHCSSFAETGGLEWLVDIATSLAFPHDFAHRPACSKLTKLLQTLIEHKPHLVVPLLINRAQQALAHLRLFQDHPASSSFFSTFFTPDASHDSELHDASTRGYGTWTIKMLLVVQNICHILSRSFSSSSHRNPPAPFSTLNLTDLYVDLVDALGKLQIRCVWESMLALQTIPSEWVRPRDANQEQSDGSVNSALDVAEDGIASNRPASNAESAQAAVLAASNSPSLPESAADQAQQSTNFPWKSDTFEKQNFLTVRVVVHHVPIEIAAYFATLGKAILPRRMPNDAYSKQNTILVAEHIAKALVSLLNYPIPSTLKPKTANYFRMVSLSLVTQAQVDKKTELVDRTSAQILTLVVQQFQKSSGIEAMGAIMRRLFEDNLMDKPDDHQDSKTSGVQFAVQGLQLALKFLTQVTNHRIVNEAHQTSALSSRTIPGDKVDQFQLPQFLVELRYQALQALLPLWNYDNIGKARPAVIRSLCSIVQNILEGAGEQGASQRGEKLHKKAKNERKPWKLRNPDRLTQLIDRDFSQGLAREALYRCNESANSAGEYCEARRRNPSLPSFPIPANDNIAPTAEPSPPTAPDLASAPQQDGGNTGTPQSAAVTSATELASLLPELPDEPEGDDNDLIQRIFREGEASSTLPGDAESSSEAPLPTTPPENGNQSAETKTDESPVLTTEDLDDARGSIRSALVERCLNILHSFEDFSFELSDLIISGTIKSSNPTAMRQDISITLIQSLLSIKYGKTSAQDSKKITAYAHLLGIVLQDKEFFDSARKELQEHFFGLADFLLIDPEHSTAKSLEWIGPILLILERVLSEDAQPQQIVWTPPGSSNAKSDEPQAEMSEPLIRHTDKDFLFKRVMDVLPRVGKDAGLGLAVVRILVSLTRNRELATQLGQKRNMQRLFVMVKQLSGVAVEKFHAAFMLVLRHIVEDEATVRNIIRTDIQELFARQSRQIDTTTYTRQLYHDVLRAPDIFVAVTNEMLVLPRFDRSQNAQALALKDQAVEKKPQEASTALLTEPTSDQQPATSSLNPPMSESQDPGKGSSDVKAPALENPDIVTQFLLSELLAYRDVEDKVSRAPIQSKDSTDVTQSAQQDVEMTLESTQPRSESINSNPSNEPSKDKVVFKAEEHPIYVYRCFIMQCLAELLQSYNRSKITFINFSRKSDPAASTPTKPRSGVLSYLLNGLIPTGSIQHPSDDGSRQKANTAGWATHVIVGLCSCTPEKGSIKMRDSNDVEAEPELVFVRKFVLEQALKAFKDTSVLPESAEPSYSRLLGLAELFNRLLAGKPTTEQARYGRAHDHQDNLVPTQKQIAKIMFEKNYIASLTSSVSEVDLNSPGASRVVKYILRPLKLLTHTAIELSLSSEVSTSPGQSDGDEISSATSISDVGEGREETPDLFRNSALGMFEPGRENHSSSESDDQDDEEDMYGEDYADDMEYDEGGHHHDGDVVSDEDEEMDGVGPMEGLPGDMSLEMEVNLNGDGHDESSTDSVDDGEGDESESGDDEEMDVVEEATGDDENHSLDDQSPEDEDEGEWEDEDPRFEDDPEPGEDLDMGEGPAESANESESALPPFDEDNPADFIGGDVAIETEGDREVPGDEESEDDADEEDDDYEEEEMGFEGPEYDDLEVDTEMPPFAWGWPPPRRRHSHHHRHHWTPMLHSQDRLIMPGFRSTRPTGASRPVDDGSNPLLSRNAHRMGPEIPQVTAQRAALHRMQLDLETAIPALPGAHPSDILRHLAQATEDPLAVPPAAITGLLNMIGQGGPLHIAPQHHHGGLALTMRGPMPSGGFHVHTTEGPLGQGGHRNHDVHVARDDPSTAVAFQPAPTDRRWQEDARMLFGASYVENSQRVINSILKLLVPPAIETETRRKAEEEEQKRTMEEQRAKEKAEQEAKEKQEQQEREAREAAEKAQAEAEAARVAQEIHDNILETSDETTGHEQPSERGEAMEGVEQTEASVESTGPEAETAPQPAEPVPRVMTNIRGRELDITDLGIDLTYLDALPEEMREEVIMQQYAEQRSNAAAAGEEPSAINTEFLNALPPDIRAELLEQEAQDRRRRERDETRRRAQESGAPAQPEEIDPASFIASLDPVLRQQVLAESDEDMLSHLPPDVVAEARALGGMHRRRALDPTNALGSITRRAGDPFPRHRNEDSKTQRRPIVQMLDKAGVATLLRLMFINVSGTSRTSLNGILLNACGNRQTRGEVVNGLLSILQDGSTDVNAVERCFNQLTLRAKQSTAPRTPQSAKGRSPLTSSTGEASPQMVVGQCLGALVFLTQSIPHIPHFFLTEHEIFGAPKSKSKGKGKAKETRASKYPFISLLSLLDRDLVINNSSNMEQLAGLMANITQPLGGMLKRERERTQGAQSSQNDSAAHALDRDQNTSHQEEQGQETGPSPIESPPEQAQPLTSGPAITNETSAPVQAGSSVQVEGRANEGNEANTATQKKDEAKKPRTLEAPDVPPEALQSVINILTARECSSKAFRDTLSMLTNLCAIQGAKDTFVEELIKQARQLGQRVQLSLGQLTESLSGVENEMQAQSIALASFSPNDSDQIKVNRVLTALDYLSDTASTSSPERSEVQSEKGPETISGFYEDPSFMELWHKLSACLTATKQSGSIYFFNVATILLPLVEALMVVCKRVPLKDSQHSKTLRSEAMSPQGPPSGMRGVFFTFTNRHRKILNDLVRHSPKLMSGSFSVLVKNSSVLEFDNKRNFFNRRLHHRSNDMRHYPHPSLQLNVRRDQVFLDSYKCLHYKNPEEIKYGRFNIRFHNEEGVDAGGVTREWFQVLARQMFNPDYALFNPVASDRTTFHPNNLSSINQEHLEFFKFIGRIIGKALYENRVLDCHFSRAVYKRILGQPVSMKDMETVDLEYSKNMEWMLNNDITDIITETFSITQDNFGVAEIVDLVENGRNIAVTEENKNEYVRLVIEYRLTGSVQKQLESFLKGKPGDYNLLRPVRTNVALGFHDIVPPELISIFDEGELELLISGMPDVDVDDWKANTEYHNYNASSPQIQWFWRAVRSFDKEGRARLLQFVTGTGKVPLNGFKELEGMNGFTRFSIHKDYGTRDRLPSSHTCFNQLDLPEYENYEALRRALYTAMTTGNEYFGYA